MTTQTPEHNALARQGQSAKRELKDWLQGEAFKNELRALLPKGMTADRFVRVAFQAVHRNPKLLKTSQESFFNCLLSLGAMGLEPDGRNAHLIPFGAECTLIVDYKGVAEVLRRNHDVASIHCDVVYTKDEYEAEQGTNQHLRHVKFKGDRGLPILAYSFVRLPDGTQEFEEMTLGEIEKIRKRSKTPNDGPWVTDWDAMARKTVFRRHAKMLPLSPETRDVLDRDLDGDALAFAQATPVTAAVVAAPAQQPRRRGRPPTRLAQDMGKLPPDEESGENASWVPPEPPAPAPATASNPAPESGPESIPEAPLHEQVRSRVIANGFTEAEMLAVMKPVRMAPPDANSLADCTGHHLGMVLTQWEDAKNRLVENRQKAHDPL